MVTLAILPCLTSSMNCEYSIGAWADCRVLNWLNTVISTSAITSQIAMFFIRLFNAPSQKNFYSSPIPAVLLAGAPCVRNQAQSQQIHFAALAAVGLGLAARHPL